MAVTLKALGLVRLASLVVDIVLAPALDAVYVNVAALELFVSETVVGEKVPPPPLLDGVITTVPLSVPVPSVTVKLEDAAPTMQADGPVRVYEVTAVGADATNEIADGLARLALLVTAML